MKTGSGLPGNWGNRSLSPFSRVMFEFLFAGIHNSHAATLHIFFVSTNHSQVMMERRRRDETVDHRQPIASLFCFPLHVTPKRGHTRVDIQIMRIVNADFNKGSRADSRELGAE